MHHTSCWLATCPWCLARRASCCPASLLNLPAFRSSTEPLRLLPSIKSCFQGPPLFWCQATLRQANACSSSTSPETQQIGCHSVLVSPARCFACCHVIGRQHKQVISLTHGPLGLGSAACECYKKVKHVMLLLHTTR